MKPQEIHSLLNITDPAKLPAELRSIVLRLLKTGQPKRGKRAVYTSKARAIKVAGVILLAAATAEFKSTFWLSYADLNDLLKDFSKYKRYKAYGVPATLSGTDYAFIMRHLTENGFLEVLQAPGNNTTRTKGVYAFGQVDVTSALFNAFAAQFFDEGEAINAWMAKDEDATAQATLMRELLLQKANKNQAQNKESHIKLVRDFA